MTDPQGELGMSQAQSQIRHSGDMIEWIRAVMKSALLTAGPWGLPVQAV